MAWKKIRRIETMMCNHDVYEQIHNGKKIVFSVWQYINAIKYHYSLYEWRQIGWYKIRSNMIEARSARSAKNKATRILKR